MPQTKSYLAAGVHAMTELIEEIEAAAIAHP
mgnify:CR=1 FL=1